jgi:uncharacterized protein YxjI
MQTILPLIVLVVSPASSSAWMSSESLAQTRRRRSRVATVVVCQNWLSDVGDALTGGKLTAQTSLPYGEPLLRVEEDALAVQERPISFTGEDFDVKSASTGSTIARVRGAMLHLPGKDKMRVVDDAGNVVALLDRKLVSMTPTYDLCRPGGTKLGWIEKAVVALTDTFEVHLEGGQFGPFKPPAAFKLEGDFIDHSFVMKNDRGEVVAKVSKEGWVPQWDAANHYLIRLADGMDAGLVIACACAIDEELDEEHQKKKRERERREGDRGWFG